MTTSSSIKSTATFMYAGSLNYCLISFNQKRKTRSTLRSRTGRRCCSRHKDEDREDEDDDAHKERQRLAFLSPSSPSLTCTQTQASQMPQVSHSHSHSYTDSKKKKYSHKQTPRRHVSVTHATHWIPEHREYREESHACVFHFFQSFSMFSLLMEFASAFHSRCPFVFLCFRRTSVCITRRPRREMRERLSCHLG